MDYKQKYEQLAKFIKDLYPHMSDYCKEKTERMIPELKESEDERIRKWLIRDIKRSLDDDVYNDESIDNAKKALAWLEKQGKQKSVDKVESKFKAGDWVVYCNEDVDLITGVEETGYIINKGSGYIPFVCEGEMRLWTIEDAKDGDVLADGDLPFIFKKIDAYNYTYAYCGISLSGNFRIESDGELGEWTWMLDIKPATKEQRELLFQKIKEAGYEWDAEKKELKEIEKKFAWSEEDETCLEDVLWAIEQARPIAKKENVLDNLRHAEKWLKSLILRPYWKPTKEQMKILRKYVMGEWRDLTIGQDKILTCLYTDLQKLL